MITCPKREKSKGVSFTISPVTHTAEVEVKRASIQRRDFPGGTAKGRERSTVPARITIRNPKIRIWAGVVRYSLKRWIQACNAASSSWVYCPLSPFVTSFQKGGQEIDGDRKDCNRIFVRRDPCQGLKKTQLDCSGVSTQDLSRVREPLCSLIFPLGVDHFCAPLPLCLGLLGNGPDHILRQVYIFYLHHSYLYSPGFSLLINNPLEICIDLLALGQKVVQLALAQDTPQRRLCNLGGGVKIILHL